MSRDGLLVVVEHDLMRTLLLELMAERLPGLTCAGVGTPDEAMLCCAEHPPSVLIFDAGMHCRRIGELAARIRSAAPRCRIIALTTHAPDWGCDYIVDGADKVVTKDAISHALAPAVFQLLARVDPESVQ